MEDNLNIKVEGHIWVDQFKTYDDVKNNNIEKKLLDKHNAIHRENMSYLIATAIGNQDNNTLYTLKLGNGGSIVDSLGNINYLQPNVVGRQITLYNETYSKIIDQTDANNPDPINNKMEVSHILGNNYTDLLVTALLDYNEPTGQSVLDDGKPNDLYTFDELGLADTNGNLCTHALFAKIQKSQNRLIRFKYRLRISIVS